MLNRLSNDQFKHTCQPLRLRILPFSSPYMKFHHVGHLKFLCHVVNTVQLEVSIK